MRPAPGKSQRDFVLQPSVAPTKEGLRWVINLLSFLESVPEVAAKLKEPETREMKFEDVVKSAEQAAVLVLVY